MEIVPLADSHANLGTGEAGVGAALWWPAIGGVGIGRTIIVVCSGPPVFRLGNVGVMVVCSCAQPGSAESIRNRVDAPRNRNGAMATSQRWRPTLLLPAIVATPRACLASFQLFHLWVSANVQLELT